MGRWSNLPGELLNAIEEHLTLHVDKVRVRAVCLSWKSQLSKMMRNQLPCLLGAFENNNKSLALFNLIEQKFDPIYVPELQGKLFRGSSHGWVAVHEEVPEGSVRIVYDSDNSDEDIPDEDVPGLVFPASSPDIFLVNPLTGVQIRLPPRCTFPDVREYLADRVGQEYTLIVSDYYDPIGSNFVHHNLMDKIVLSSSPVREDCVVVAIYGQLGTLAWCKCNDKNWTPIGDTDFSLPFVAFEDVIFYNDRLHAVKTNGQLVVFENIGSGQKVTETVVANALHHPRRPYLVECSNGVLLMVEAQGVEEGLVGFDVQERVVKGLLGFEVYKLDSNTSSWNKVNNIGDDMLFLGINYSMSIPAHKIPGYKGNCIYFADEPFVFMQRDDKSFHSRIGVFNMANKTIESLSGFECLPKFLWPPPIWVAPPN
ncbi:hypothetical protein LguiA_014020 [Lonicera macranthoides]